MRSTILSLLLLGLATNAGATGRHWPQLYKKGWSGSVSYSAGLSELSVGGENHDAEATPRSHTVSANVRYNPVTEWYARVTVVAYVDRDRQQVWDPDFTYGFGYSNWRPGTWSVTYENYGGNCFRCTGGNPSTRILEGAISANYKLPVKKGPVSGSLSAQAVPRFFNLSAGDRQWLKTSMSAEVRVKVRERWYAGGRATFYPIQGQQQPWDPDFTYSMGYSDWRPGTFSVEYSNYAPNRFPGRSSGRPTTFRDGSLTITYKFPTGAGKK